VAGSASPIIREAAIRSDFIFVIFVLFEVKFY
jgi:hypothetical protein